MSSDKTCTTLWYSTPAGDWLEGLPVGTGRLAGMAMGWVKTERIALNHEWLWRGGYRHRDNRPVADRLPKVRELLLAGNYEAGTEAGNLAFGASVGDGGHGRVDPYQPAGDLYLEFNHGSVGHYRRELDLETGLVTIANQTNRGRFHEEVIADLEHDLLLVRITYRGGDPDHLLDFACRVWLDRSFDSGCRLTKSADGDTLRLGGAIEGGTRFAVQARLFARGPKVSLDHGTDARCMVTGVNELIVAVDVDTDSKGGTPDAGRRLAEFEPGSWKDVLAAHRAALRRYTGPFALDVRAAGPDLPTDERIRRVRDGHRDPALSVLYYHYGRYLLVASSARGELPANLQGKWCEDLNPPWESDYHHDINLQMNYWACEGGGMQEAAEALLQHIERFAPHGRKAAMDLYGCRGIWMPIQTDAWGRSTPESSGWAVWVGAAPWLAQHLWWHYEYSLDDAFLRDRAYPFMKGVAEFFEDYLIEGEDGTLLCVPSQSPENTFEEGNRRAPVTLCVNSSSDLEMIWDLLTHAVRAAEILGADPDKRRLWSGMLERLPVPGVGSKGQLLEWNREFRECEPGHRHVSHLFGLFPGEQFCPFRTPELYRAACRALELRLAAGGGHTGWSRAWMACLFARMGQGDLAMTHLEHLITDFASRSLLDLHPPRIFQIDGNLGGVAAVQEMLLQSYHGDLHLLPALPANWPEGDVKGLRARGAFDVDIAWRGGAVVEARITSRKGTPCRIVDPQGALAVRTAGGAAAALKRDGHVVTFATTPGATYTVAPKNA